MQQFTDLNVFEIGTGIFEIKRFLPLPLSRKQFSIHHKIELKESRGVVREVIDPIQRWNKFQ